MTIPPENHLSWKCLGFALRVEALTAASPLTSSPLLKLLPRLLSRLRKRGLIDMGRNN
jgi:hypothetical protein